MQYKSAISNPITFSTINVKEKAICYIIGSKMQKKKKTVRNESKYTARTKCLVHFFWGIKVMIVDNSSSPPTATTPRKQSGYTCTFNMVNTPELDMQLYWFKRDKVLTEKLI